LSTRAKFYKAVIPGVISVFLVLLGSVNINIAGIASFVPLYLVMTVYFWSIYSPYYMPKWFVFLIGLFQDILYGMPMGISALLLLVLWGIVVSQRRHLTKEPFIVVWIMFVITIGFYIVAEWLINSIYFGELIFSPAIIMQLIVSVLIYPLIHKLYEFIHTFFLKTN